ncbi:MAG: HAD-IA family hydrolase [bacterium]
MKYKAIGFDYGGVIAGISGSEFNRQITELLNVDLEVYKTVYFNNNHLLNNGVLSVADFWREILIKLDRLNKLDNVLEFLKSVKNPTINNDLIDLAKYLKSLGYKLGILSNNTPEAAKTIEGFNWEDIFEVIIVSAKVGLSKPNPKLFNMFIQELNIEPQELVFIDDTENSLKTAKEVGFYPISYKGIIELKAELNKIGVLSV